MEPLLALLALVPIALLILMVVLINKISGLSRELRVTREQIAAGQLINSAITAEGPKDPIQPREPPEVVVRQVHETPPKQTPQKEVDPTLARLRALFPETVAGDSPEPLVVGSTHTEEAATAQVVAPSRGSTQQAPPHPSFFERHPDLEKFIGESLINKVGITVLVIGIGLLLRYAIGKDMISETGRTLIGLLAGGVLVFFAHRSRTGFRAFSSVLVAGGLAVFYSTIAIAFHQYHLIGQAPAFIVMVMITALAVLLTLAYDRKELAVIALLGGFAAPFLVSTGEGNFKVLFTYLLILDIGMLVLANYKKWLVINVLSFGLTLLIFGAWAAGPYADLEPRPALIAFAFASGFFLVFFGMNLRYNLRHRQAFTALDHSLLLLNTGAFYTAGMYLLSDLPLKLTGLFTVLLGLFYLLFAVHFHRKEGIPRNLKLMLIGLVLTFISLAAPVQLEGNYITLFWAAEAVLLLWFAQRSALRIVERASVFVLVLMALSLAMDLFDSYGWSAEETMRPLLNKGWITGMACALVFGVYTHLMWKHERDKEPPRVSAFAIEPLMTAIAGVLVLYLTNFLEQQYQLLRVVDPSVVDMALMAYTLFFVLVLDLKTLASRSGIRIAIGVLLALCSAHYITGFYASSRSALYSAQNGSGGEGFAPFHYLAFAFMVIAVVRIAMVARERIGIGSHGWNVYLWCICGFLVVFASQELDHAMLLFNHEEPGFPGTLMASRRVGYPILWGVGSFLFMVYGMRKRMRMMRIIALVLFAITLVKLFLFDLGALSEGGRVAAFIFLGALLLVISFMYQKLKVLLKDDTPNVDNGHG